MASDRAGWENLFSCEINPFCNEILKYYWPKARHYQDITQTDFSDWRGKVNVLSGGFPCQPFSVAGSRRGADDDRHLWPEMVRSIREIQPDWVVGENVRGLINWNEEMVFQQIHTDLENEGYEVIPILIPACGLNAPHRRERLWIIAHRPNSGSESMWKRWENQTNQSLSVANANRKLLEGGLHTGKPGIPKKDTGIFSRNAWKNFPSQSPICGRDDGFPFGLDGKAFFRWRKESIKGYGNAIVPQIAQAIFETISEIQYEYYQQR